MGAFAWVASPLPSILEWRAWTADQTIAITAMTPTAAAIMRLRIRHLLADGTRMALAYGGQPQCEAFHTAEIKVVPLAERRRARRISWLILPNLLPPRASPQAHPGSSS